MKTARDEYDMQFNVVRRMDDTWDVFDMDMGVTVGRFLTREAAFERMKLLNEEAKL